MSAHRQNFTPSPRDEAADVAFADVGLAIVIGVALALLALHWCLQ